MGVYHEYTIKFKGWMKKDSIYNNQERGRGEISILLDGPNRESYARYYIINLTGILESDITRCSYETGWDGCD